MPAAKYTLQLTRKQLEHVRDLLSIEVATDEDDHMTVSGVLASYEDRVHAELSLWRNVWKLCEDAGLDVGDDAPDLFLEPTSIRVALGIRNSE